MTADAEKALEALTAHERGYRGAASSIYKDEIIKTIRLALQILDRVQRGETFECVKKTHVPQHGGDTGYDYYVLREGRNVSD